MLPEGTWVAIITAVFCLLLYAWMKKLWNIKDFMMKVRKIPNVSALPILEDAYKISGVKEINDFINMCSGMWEKKKTATGFWFLFDYYVLIGTAEDAQVILNGKQKTDKADIYKLMETGLPGLLTSADDIWKRHRKIISPFFQASAMNEFVKVFSLVARKACKNLEEKVEKPDFDINAYLEDALTHTFIEILIPEEIRLSFSTKANYFMDNAMKILNEIYVIIPKPWLHSKHVFKISRRGRCILKHVANCRNAARELVFETKNIIKRKKMLNEGQGQSFLEYMVSVEESGKNCLSVEEMVDEFITMVVSSWETTVRTLGFAIHMISKHQHIQDRIIEEINLELGPDDTRELTPEALNRLKYLEQVIKETLRFYAPANLIARKLLEDVTLKSGCVLPKGSNALMLMHIIHRDPDMYPNPDTFDPDNFLPENIAKRPAYAYMPFSLGPRNCIGQKYAMLSLKTNIVHILRNFEVTADAQFEPDILAGFVVHSINGIRVALKRRKELEIY